MKNIYISLSKIVLGISFLALSVSCEKDHNFSPNSTYIDNSNAKLKFIHTSLNSTVSELSYGFNFFLDQKKISAVPSTTGYPFGFTYGSIYPVPNNYALVPNGSQTLRVERVERVVQSPIGPTFFPAITVATNTVNFASGKYYSSFLVDFLPNSMVFTVNDEIDTLDKFAPNAFIRFFNFIPNTPAAGYDLVFIKTIPATPSTPMSTMIVKTFSGITYKGGSEIFVPIESVPELESGAYKLELRTAGTTTIVASLATGFVPRNGRVYTAFARGNFGGFPNATTQLPVIAFYTNR